MWSLPPGGDVWRANFHLKQQWGESYTRRHFCPQSDLITCRLSTYWVFRECEFCFVWRPRLLCLVFVFFIISSAVLHPQVFPDNAAGREIASLPARCLNEGCSWTGSIKQYEVSKKIHLMPLPASPLVSPLFSKRVQSLSLTKFASNFGHSYIP